MHWKHRLARPRAGDPTQWFVSRSMRHGPRCDSSPPKLVITYIRKPCAAVLAASPASPAGAVKAARSAPNVRSSRARKVHHPAGLTSPREKRARTDMAQTCLNCEIPQNLCHPRGVRFLDQNQDIAVASSVTGCWKHLALFARFVDKRPQGPQGSVEETPVVQFPIAQSHKILLIPSPTPAWPDCVRPQTFPDTPIANCPPWCAHPTRPPNAGHRDSRHKITCVPKFPDK